ncbi:MAG TPA: protein kinase, partial [bacterium]|nr:protein kinase [bacterium]
MGNPQPGYIQSRYQVTGLICHGQHGDIYEVRDTERNNRILALKMLRKHTTAAVEDAFRDAFKRMARLDHPRFAAVYDFGRDSATRNLFYTMEHVPGVPITRDALTGKAVIREFIGLCRAVRQLHCRGLVHGALCSQKIIVPLDRSPDMANVKILDYGW